MDTMDRFRLWAAPLGPLGPLDRGRDRRLQVSRDEKVITIETMVQ